MPLRGLCLAWLVGMAAIALAWPLPLVLSAGGVLAAGLAVIAWRFGGPRWAPLLGLLLALGAWRYAMAATASLGDLGQWAETAERFIAVVEAGEQRDEEGRYVVRVEAVASGDAWTAASGRVLVSRVAYPEWRPGDRLVLHGRLSTPDNRPDFDYRAYLARRGIGWLLRYPAAERVEPAGPTAGLVALQERFNQALAWALPEPQAALAIGLLSGAGGSFPETLKEDLIATGTLHLVAVSGFNISLVAGALTVIAVATAGRRYAAYLALPALALFVAYVGPSPSVVRAALMGALAVLAYRVGRQYAGVHALVLASALMLAVQPLWLNEIGFQLSVLATLGLMLSARWVQRLPAGWLARCGSARPVVRALVEGGLTTLGATLATLPLLLTAFGQLSLVALPVNTLVAPLVAPSMLLAFLAGLAGSLWLPLGTVLGWLAWAPLSLLLGLIELGARFPLAALTVDRLPVELAFASYGAAALARWLWPRRSRLRWPASIPAGRVADWALLGAGCLGVAAWTFILTEPEKRFQFSVLGAGEDAVIVASDGSGRRVLIGGAASPDALATALGAALPFWDRRFDLVLPLRDDRDQLTGLLPLIERTPVDLAYAPSGSDALARRYRVALDARRIERLAPTVPATLWLGEQLAVEILPLAGPRDRPASRVVIVRGVGGAVLAAVGLTAEQARSLRAAPVDLVVLTRPAPDVLAPLVERLRPGLILFAGSLPPDRQPEGIQFYAVRATSRLDFAAHDGWLVWQAGE